MTGRCFDFMSKAGLGSYDWEPDSGRQGAVSIPHIFPQFLQYVYLSTSNLIFRRIVDLLLSTKFYVVESSNLYQVPIMI
jgi:hypothetical protein